MFSKIKPFLFTGLSAVVFILLYRYASNKLTFLPKI